MLRAEYFIGFIIGYILINRKLIQSVVVEGDQNGQVQSPVCTPMAISAPML
jgi:hypothetical protein